MVQDLCLVFLTHELYFSISYKGNLFIFYSQGQRGSGMLRYFAIGAHALSERLEFEGYWDCLHSSISPVSLTPGGRVKYRKQ